MYDKWIASALPRNDVIWGLCMILRNLLTNIPLVCILILDTVGMYVTK